MPCTHPSDTRLQLFIAVWFLAFQFLLRLPPELGYPQLRKSESEPDLPLGLPLHCAQLPLLAIVLYPAPLLSHSSLSMCMFVATRFHTSFFCPGLAQVTGEPGQALEPAESRASKHG